MISTVEFNKKSMGQPQLHEAFATAIAAHGPVSSIDADDFPDSSRVLFTLVHAPGPKQEVFVTSLDQYGAVAIAINEFLSTRLGVIKVLKILPQSGYRAIGVVIVATSEDKSITNVQPEEAQGKQDQTTDAQPDGGAAGSNRRRDRKNPSRKPKGQDNDKALPKKVREPVQQQAGSDGGRPDERGKAGDLEGYADVEEGGQG